MGHTVRIDLTWPDDDDGRPIHGVVYVDIEDDGSATVETFGPAFHDSIYAEATYTGIKTAQIPVAIL